GASDAGAAYLFTLETYTPGLAADTVRANSITTASLEDGAVTSSKIKDGSITTADLADGAVTAAKVSAEIALRAGGNGFTGNQTVSAGNVGIGTTSPQTALHIRAPQQSQLRLQDPVLNRTWDIYTESFNNSGNLLFLNDIGVAAWLRRSDGFFIDGSDARLKRDISPLNGVLERMLQLRPVSYRLKSAPTNAPLTLGLIAQEVEPLFPEVVGEHGGMKGLAYSQLVPITVGAIQELNQKLESKLQQKETEIAELKQSLAELKVLVQSLVRKQNAAAK